MDTFIITMTIVVIFILVVLWLLNDVADNNSKNIKKLGKEILKLKAENKK